MPPRRTLGRVPPFDATIGVKSLLAKIVMSGQNVGKIVVTTAD
jgi:hypothetical protein